jgi:histidinol-phosphate aminotransferase
MRGAIREDTRLVFIASPNNPTGLRLPNSDLENFFEAVPATTMVILDEAYYEFLSDPPPSIEWLERFPNLILTRTFSKIQGLAALRIGYGLAREDCANVLQRCRQPFNANALAQAAALASFLDTAHQEKTREMTIQGREDLESFCREEGIEYLPSEANFVLMKTGEADRLFTELQKRGIIIRSMTGYGLPDWIRVSIGTPEQMKTFKSQLLDVLA